MTHGIPYFSVIFTFFYNVINQSWEKGIEKVAIIRRFQVFSHRKEQSASRSRNLAEFIQTCSQGTLWKEKREDPRNECFTKRTVTLGYVLSHSTDTLLSLQNLDQ